MVQNAIVKKILRDGVAEVSLLRADGVRTPL